jgi:hypothetical protein
MDELYRDRSAGAAARREELLRRRRAELVTMPHAVRRVVVGRSSRVTASAVAAAAGALLLTTSWWPALAGWLGRAMPGAAPAALATLLVGAWVAGALAWGWSRARGEHRFIVAMSRYVLPTADVDHDVERLDHERPDREARALAHQREVWSAAWPLLAAALVLPATILWLTLMVRQRGWAVSAIDDALARHHAALTLVAAIGAVGAIAAVRPAMRRRGVALVAGPLGLLAVAGAVTVFVRGAPWAGWSLAGAGGTALALAAVAWRVDRERALLAIADPAAGIELFTLRGALRAVRAGLGRLRAALLRVRPRYRAIAAAAALVSVVIGLAVRAGGAGQPAAAASASASAAATSATDASATDASATDLPTGDEATVRAPSRPPVAGAPANARAAHTRIEHRSRRWVVETTLDDRGERTIALPDLAVVPDGWMATIHVSLATGEKVGVLRDPGVDDDRVEELSSDPFLGPQTQLYLRACNGPRPFELRLRERSTPGARLALHVAASLELVHCDR